MYKIFCSLQLCYYNVNVNVNYNVIIMLMDD